MKRAKTLRQRALEKRRAEMWLELQKEVWSLYSPLKLFFIKTVSVESARAENFRCCDDFSKSWFCSRKFVSHRNFDLECLFEIRRFELTPFSYHTTPTVVCGNRQNTVRWILFEVKLKLEGKVNQEGRHELEEIKMDSKAFLQVLAAKTKEKKLEVKLWLEMKLKQVAWKSWSKSEVNLEKTCSEKNEMMRIKSHSEEISKWSKV